MRLGRSDLEAVVKFLGEAATLENDAAYTPSLLHALQALIPADAITYQEYEYENRRQCAIVAIGPEGDDVEWALHLAPLPDPEDELYWRVGPCPITHHRARTSSADAVRMSDLVPSARFRELPVYREYFRRHDIEHMLDLGLQVGPAPQRSLILFRERVHRDFSERDRAALQLLRPHFAERERMATVRQQLADALRARPQAGEAGVPDTLTSREREIIDLVAEGKTNAEIAAQLWVAPSTVKKHLENIYRKVGIGRRAGVAHLAGAVTPTGRTAS